MTAARLLALLALSSMSACTAPARGVARSPERPLRCAGRFAFQPPSALREGRSEYFIYGTRAHAERLAGRDPATLWAETVARWEAKRKPEDPPLAFFELTPGVPGLVAQVQGQTLMEVLRTTEGAALWLLRDLPADKVPAAQKLLGNISAAFSEDTSRGFCLGEAGSIALASQSESLRVRYGLPGAEGFSLEVSTVTVTRPASGGQDLDAERDFARSTGADLSVARDEGRSVAGQRGREIWLSMAAPGKPTLVRRTFATRGQPEDSTRPHLQLRGTARAEDAEALSRAFVEILDSLEQLPVAGPPGG